MKYFCSNEFHFKMNLSTTFVLCRLVVVMTESKADIVYIRRLKSFMVCFLFNGVVTLILVIISHFYAQYSTTALHNVAANGNHEICLCLVEHNASWDAQDFVRDNPLKEYALCKL